MMINPIIGSFEAFLAIYFSLPIAVQAFVDISLVLFVVNVIVNLIRGS